MSIPSFNQWFEAHYYHLVRAWSWKYFPPLLTDAPDLFSDKSFIDYAQDVYIFVFDINPK